MGHNLPREQVITWALLNSSTGKQNNAPLERFGAVSEWWLDKRSFLIALNQQVPEEQLRRFMFSVFH